MAQLTVRGIDDAVVAALKERALASGRSAEAEHRRILEDALHPGRGGDFFAAARTRRVRLRDPALSTADLLRQDRDRDEA